MTTNAELVSNILDTQGARIVTLKLRYPSCVHADLMARRELSLAALAPEMSAASLIEEVLRDPVVPLLSTRVEQRQPLQVPAFIEPWQQGELMTLSELAEFRDGTRLDIVAAALSTDTYFADVDRAQEFAWLEARDLAVVMAKRLQRAGHDAIARRLLEPFLHVEVTATASDWDLFLQWTSQFPAGSDLAQLGHCIGEQLEKIEHA